MTSYAQSTNRAKKKGVLEGDLDMTSMIDIVFMLLIFFILTFNPTKPETNFSLVLLQSPPGEEILEEPLPAVRLLGAKNGDLREVALVESSRGEKLFAPKKWQVVPTTKPDPKSQDPKTPLNKAHSAELTKIFGELREIMKEIKASGEWKDPQITIFCSKEVRYHYLIEALSAVSGERVNSDNPDEAGEVVNIFPKIQFKIYPVEP